MNRIVLIDGENLLHGLRALVGRGRSKVSREHFLEFPFKDLLREVLEDDAHGHIFFYGTRLKRYEQTEDLKNKTEEIISQQARLVSTLQRQGIQFVKAGYLRARETDKCAHCGHAEWHLMEKGVDVGLTVKMLTDIPRGTEIVLISSDTDLLPAVKAAKAQGSKITYVGYEYGPVVSLVRAADRTRVITSQMVKKYLPKKEDAT